MSPTLNYTGWLFDTNSWSQMVYERYANIQQQFMRALSTLKFDFLHIVVWITSILLDNCIIREVLRIKCIHCWNIVPTVTTLFQHSYHKNRPMLIVTCGHHRKMYNKFRSSIRNRWGYLSHHLLISDITHFWTRVCHVTSFSFTWGDTNEQHFSRYFYLRCS